MTIDHYSGYTGQEGNYSGDLTVDAEKGTLSAYVANGTGDPCAYSTFLESARLDEVRERLSMVKYSIIDSGELVPVIADASHSGIRINEGRSNEGFYLLPRSGHYYGNMIEDGFCDLQDFLKSLVPQVEQEKCPIGYEFLFQCQY